MRKIQIKLARESFYDFCVALNPDFYKPDRKYLKDLCDRLEDIYKGNIVKNGKTIKRLMINMPPRHGKSLTLMYFSMWLMGIDASNKVITVSYNSILSSSFSKGVRDGITTENADPNKIFFEDIFPETKIKYGDASASKWALEGSFFNYLGTGMGGTITGVGCNVGIIDDPVKNSEEAFNDIALQKQWDFYRDTFLSRLESGAIQIINMTRWAEGDLCGRLLDLEPDKWDVMLLPAYDSETDQMLCEEILSREDYEDRKPPKTSPEIFYSNYHQEPIDKIGLMYDKFKIYDVLPDGQDYNYTDTADTGADYLCSINYRVSEKKIYILDIVFSKESMESTEPAVAKMLTKDKIALSMIESNNGGRGFARNVKRLMEELGNHFTEIKSFTQKQNKVSRIYNNAHWICENVYYPKNWVSDYPEFYESMRRYKKEGKNKHDDAQDCLTGCAEQVNRIERTF